MNWQTLQASLRANGIVRLLLSKVVTFRFWPGVRVRHVATKLSFAETVGVANGGFVAPAGTHTPGQEQTVAP